MMYARIAGIRIAYEQRGEGHPNALLLIHGFPFDHRMWSAQMDPLSSRQRVVAPDLRGSGRSEVSPGPYTMDRHADDMAGLLDHLGIGRAVVCGLSMGGYVAFALWRRHRDRVRALVLADTRPGPDGEPERANRDKAIEQVRQAGVEAYAEQMIPRLLAPANANDERIAGTVRQMMADQPPAGVIGSLLGMRDRPDSRAMLRTISVPVLVVAGVRDALTPPAEGQKMVDEIPSAQMAVIPEAGHLSPLENPGAFNQGLAVFLDSLGQSG